MTNSVRTILTQARAGATSRAWDSFVAAGLGDVTDNPAALTLKGRLLKDRARKASSEAAARLYLQSAKAYADAAALRPDSYPLINAATMSLFAGQPDHMALLAQRVLDMLYTGSGVGETPYWHEATRAEALLLLGRHDDARAALDKAIVAAPAAWEDRAATLRQFREISQFRGEACAWLAKYAPPASVYFKGMIGISPEDLHAADITREAVASAETGFGYGALAAGVDILIAEALVQSGAELHVVLPIIPSAFRAQSVAPFGETWLPRFDYLFEQAASVTVVVGGETLTDTAIDLAFLVAKGAAIENAGRLEGSMAGLELNDSPSPQFDDASDRFIRLDRTAPVAPSRLTKGTLSLTVISDDPGDDHAGWSPIAEGFFAHQASSLAAANAAIVGLRRAKPDARCALKVAASEALDNDTDERIANLLRLAQCAVAGTVVSDAISTRAMLSVFPGLRTEPLGELPDAGGAVEIYAIDPVA